MRDIKWLLSKPIAHRGLHNEELPENSLGAFENAIKNDYPIELDVHLTDDNEVVVFHDNALGRMTGHDGFICNMKLEELKKLKLLNAEKKPSVFGIPTLPEVLDIVNAKVPLLIEIKSQSTVGQLEKAVANILKNYNGKYAIQSFNPYSVEYFKNNLPDAPRGVLSCFFTKEQLKGSIKRYFLKTLKLNKIAKPDFISYRAENLPNKYVSRTNLPVLAWTVRTEETKQALCGIANNIIFESFIPN